VTSLIRRCRRCAI